MRGRRRGWIRRTFSKNVTTGRARWSCRVRGSSVRGRGRVWRRGRWGEPSLLSRQESSRRTTEDAVLQPTCPASLRCTTVEEKQNRAASIQWNVVSLIFSFDVTKIRLSLAVCFDSFSTVTHPEKSVVASAARIYPCDRVPYLGYRFGCVGSRGHRSTCFSCSLGGQQLGSAQIGARGLGTRAGPLTAASAKKTPVARSFEVVLSRTEAAFDTREKTLGNRGTGAETDKLCIPSASSEGPSG